MDFGMPTLIENKNLEETVMLCKEWGLQFIELNMNFPMYQVPCLEETDYLNELARKNGIYFTIHLDENLNICDFNRFVSDAYMETVERTLKAAQKNPEEYSDLMVRVSGYSALFTSLGESAQNDVINRTEVAL